GQALMSDALATTVGSILGTSTCVAYIESASGVAEGGRTGLTALVVALLFLASLFFSPLVGMVPGVATAPVLIIVGIFMMEPIMKIDFSNFLEAAPAFLTIAIMPFTYDIAEGIVWGVLAYVFLHLVTGNAKKISVTMWVLAVLFVIRFFI
ncbi:MAG: solute carrier family 23 protein, partial [Moorellaceae bacterium]